ncbi:MAG: carbohydrate ABC transporter permease [Candidatus Micrarchaeia archaeon]
MVMNKKIIKNINIIVEYLIKYVILLIFLVFALIPILWMILTSIRPYLEIFSTPPTLFVKNITFENYYKVFSDKRFIGYFSNSLSVSIISALFSLLISASAGYAFSRFTFKGKNLLFLSVIFCQLIPLMAILIPLYTMFSQLNLIDNPFALVLSYFILTLPFSTWMSRAAFKQVPIEIEESALIDGCNRFQALFKITLPIAAPSLAAIFLFCFIEAWNEYVLAMTLINSTIKRTIQVGIMLYRSEFYTEWGTLMAASTIASIPIMIIFILIQKYLVSGLAAGALKR